MAILKIDENALQLNIHCEEISDNDVKISIANEVLQLNIDVIGQSYHDALWNLCSKLDEAGIELICNGV